MEPMSFFADVKAGKAALSGPLQKAEFTEQTVSERLGIPVENIDIELTRLGGGYGRRSYSHWAINSNITIGSFWAARFNFMASVEQSFLDEVAEAAGKDPVDFRLELLDRAKNNPVGERNDYDAARYAGVLTLLREKLDWDNPPAGIHRGVSAYFCRSGT